MSDVSDLVARGSSWASGTVDLGSLLDEWALRVLAYANTPIPAAGTEFSGFLASLRIRDAIHLTIRADGAAIQSPLLEGIDRLFRTSTMEDSEGLLRTLSEEANSGGWWWTRIPADDSFVHELNIWRASQ